MPLLTIAVIIGILVLAVVLVIAGIRAPQASDPISSRLAEYSVREEAMTLEEIELSQRFYERVMLPIFNKIGMIAARFTPQATLETARLKLIKAGNPMQMDPSFFIALRFVLAVVLGGGLFLVFSISGRNWLQGLGISALFMALGYFLPDLWLSSKVSARQKAVFRGLPDALDLLTICVEAGLGFDAAMRKVNQKWEDELALEFGRVIQEIGLGKLRREALRDMAEAHRAPIKMIFPIALLIFPSIMLILLGPAALLLITSPMAAMF